MASKLFAIVAILTGSGASGVVFAAEPPPDAASSPTRLEIFLPAEGHEVILFRMRRLPEISQLILEGTVSGNMAQAQHAPWGLS